MQTKNINHDHHHHTLQANNQHRPGCASFRVQKSHCNSTTTAAATTTTSATVAPAIKSNSSVSTVNGRTCHTATASAPVVTSAVNNNRSKTPVDVVATITCDDSFRLDTEQVPTNERPSSALTRCSHDNEHLLQSVLSASQSLAVSSSFRSSPNVAPDPTDNGDCFSFVRPQEDIHYQHRSSSGDQANEHSEHCQYHHSHFGGSTNSTRRITCLSGSQPSLASQSSFVNGSHQQNSHLYQQQTQHQHYDQHQSQQAHQGHQHSTGCHSTGHQMLLCAPTNSKTPPHHPPVAYTAPAHQSVQPQPPPSASSSSAARCSPNATSDLPLSSAAITSQAKSHSKFGHSNTLPPNSTLSSLLASAKANDQRKMQQQQELRRQTSLNHLDQVTSARPKTTVLSKNEPKVGSFQQRIKAMLSPQKERINSKLSVKPVHDYAPRVLNSVAKSVSQSNLCAAEGPMSSAVNDSAVTCDVYPNVNDVCVVPKRMDRPLSTLNKFTISASSTNLASHSQHHHHNQMMSTELDNFPEDDTYNLRNVCNKLFAHKQYSCLHSSGQLLSDNMMNSVQKSSSTTAADQSCYRNITPEMNVDKVTRKENIYSAYNQRNVMPNKGDTGSKEPDSHRLVSSAESGQLPRKSLTDCVDLLKTCTNGNLPHCPNGNVQIGSSESREMTDHVVIVSNLDTKDNSNNNGLTVRSQTPHRVDSPKSIHATNQGSNLSLNVAEPTESVASQEQNYKSSSESGRGTMNSHVEDRSSNNIDLNSPADLTSLDSDQSHPMDANWNEQNDNCGARRCADSVAKSNYTKIQRYLVEQRCPGTKETDLAMCKEFKSKLSLNEESDCWTSLSDEPTMKKPASKSKANPGIPKNTTVKHRYPVDNKLKTNFSKPENCLNGTTKPAPMSGTPMSPGMKPKVSPNAHKLPENIEMNTQNGKMYDKCIYSVPNKGKYRNMAPYGPSLYDNKMCNGTYDKDCDNGSLSSETAFPDDGCSEFVDYLNNDHHHRDPLRKQLRGIEDMYSELLSMLNSRTDQKPRRKLFRRNSGRSSVASRNTRDYIYRKHRNDHRGRYKSEDSSQMGKRYKKLESQVLTLAKSVSQLSADIQFNYMLNDEMESLRHEIEMIKSQLSNLKQSFSNMSKAQQQQQQQAAVAQQQHYHQHQQQPQQQHHQASATLNRNGKESKKVDKLKRLFVDEPQPMKQFLKKLGYEKYLKQFEAEKIGLAELVHLNEDRLQKLGIPMGPRIRILQEAKNLTMLLNGGGGGGCGAGKQISSQQQQIKSPHQNAPDTFNIYAMV